MRECRAAKLGTSLSQIAFVVTETLFQAWSAAESLWPEEQWSAPRLRQSTTIAAR
jgi:hypothetical protein